MKVDQWRKLIDEESLFTIATENWYNDGNH